MLRSFKILLISSLYFLICGAPTIRFNAVRPALINVPDHIQSIGIIDRSERPKTSATTFERIITAELPNEGKIASQIAIDGLAGFLMNTQRFTVVRSGIIMVKESRANEFPKPLSQEEINSLCKELNVDAIVSLEVFNSDYIIPTSMAIVNVGFRLYDLKNYSIFDQEQFRHEIFWKRQVSSGLEAIGRVLDKDKAIKEASFQAGEFYAQRISPSPYSISREYYNKPGRNKFLSTGGRMIEVNNWDAAIENLSKAVETGKRRVAGRASHNLAVVYEIRGDLETANRYAQNAWGLYRNRGSRNYSYILGQRIEEQRILDFQDGK